MVKHVTALLSRALILAVTSFYSYLLEVVSLEAEHTGMHAAVVSYGSTALVMNAFALILLRCHPRIAFVMNLAALASPSAAICIRACDPHAECVNSSCRCLANYTGNKCETLLRPVAPRQFDVPFTGGVFFYHRVRKPGTVSVQLDRFPSNIAHSFSPLPVLFVTHGNATSKPPPLTSSAPQGDDFRLYNWTLDRGGVLMRKRYQAVVIPNARRRDMLYLAVYQRGWLTQSSSPGPPIHVAVHVRECGPFPLYHRCGLRASSQSEISGHVTVLALPVVLGTLALLIMAACTRAWARLLWRPVRVAYGAPALDRLAPSETEAMFPRFVFNKLHASELGANDETGCAVCLSGYEEGDLLRRLRCGHSYHAACLDEWLDTNASCPRCRKPARIRLAFAARLAVLRMALMRLMRPRTNSDNQVDTTNGGPPILPV